jgi:hypothetical protein
MIAPARRDAVSLRIPEFVRAVLNRVLRLRRKTGSDGRHSPPKLAPTAAGPWGSRQAAAGPRGAMGLQKGLGATAAAAARPARASPTSLGAVDRRGAQKCPAAAQRPPCPRTHAEADGPGNPGARSTRTLVELRATRRPPRGHGGSALKYAQKWPQGGHFFTREIFAK